MLVSFYDFRDLLRCFVVGLNPRAIALGSIMVALLMLLVGPWVGIGTVSPSEYQPELRNHLPEALTLSNLLLLLVSLLSAFIVFSLGSTILMRASAAEYCRWKRLGLGELKAFLMTDALSALNFPIVLGVFGAPIVLIGGAMALLWMIPDAGLWLAGGLGLVTSPILLPAFFLTILMGLASPMFFASIAVQGPDAFEAVSRSTMYVRRRPVRYLFILAQKFVILHTAMVAAWIVKLKVDDVCEPSSAFVLTCLAFGYACAVGTASDVVLFLRMRFEADAMPYSEYYDPFEVVFDKATTKERDLAFKVHGVEVEDPDVYPVEQSGQRVL